jgi:hypothetical protein
MEAFDLDARPERWGCCECDWIGDEPRRLPILEGDRVCCPTCGCDDVADF